MERPTPPAARPPTLGRLLLVLLLVLLLAPWLLRIAGFSGSGGAPISYSELRRQVERGNVERVVLRGDVVRGELAEPIGEDAEQTLFTSQLPTFAGEELLALLHEQGVEVEARPTSDLSWGLVLIAILPIVLLVGMGALLLRRLRGGNQQMFSMGSSRAKQYVRRRERTSFADVAGAEGAKRELEEIIEYLREPRRFRALGAKPPKGVLLVGPPGTGKTLLARAVAGEAEVPFFSITGSDFMEMFVGVGASRVRNLFRDARRESPAIIFIDELDSIGRRRGAGIGGGHDEREQTLNQLLSEMDGFEAHEGVIVMAATNRPDILDPALQRPGRFDRRVTVDAPTLSARRAILEVHARNKPLSHEVDLAEVARGTPGFSGADLENLLNEAALLAARDGKAKVGRSDVDMARDKILLGLKREGLAFTDEELRLLAYHEAGHAVVAAVLPHADPVHKVTIVPRGRAMGVTQQLPEKEKYVYPREYMLDRMAVMMGGRAAEEMVFETSTSGAENDLKEVTRLARTMILDWGMSDRLGHLALGGRREHVFLGEELAEGRDYSEQTAREVDEEIRATAEQAFRRAHETLREHRAGLDRLARELLECEEVPGARVLELLGLTRADAVSEGTRVDQPDRATAEAV